MNTAVMPAVMLTTTQVCERNRDNMKEIYENAEFEVIRFEGEDIITNSLPFAEESED